MSGLAIVTGGAQGIGWAVVETLLDQEVADRVAVFDLNPTLPSAAADLGDRVAAYRCDVTDEGSVIDAYRAVGETPTILINNAGGGRIGAIGGMGAGGLEAGGQESSAFDPFAPVDDFRTMVDLNFTSAHIVTRVVGPELEAGAAICNTASVAGQTAGRLFAYGAAKAALIHWTKAMAKELAPRRIRVNAVAPGIIRTRLWEAMQPDDDAYNAMIDQIMPMGEDQSPVDIANSVAFLCSDRASQVTGEVIRIDGGFTLR